MSAGPPDSPEPPSIRSWIDSLDLAADRRLASLQRLEAAWTATLKSWKSTVPSDASTLDSAPNHRRARDLLSDRENEVLSWMMDGKSLAETAIILKISPRTVEKHRENLRIKLRGSDAFPDIL